MVPPSYLFRGETTSDELKVYPLMLHESTMQKLQARAAEQGKKVENIIEKLIYGETDLIELYNVERKLSQVLQPETNLPTIHRLVTQGRNSIRDFMRKKGYAGQF